MMPIRSYWGCFSVGAYLWATLGCNPYWHATGGYVTPVSEREGRTGALVNLQAGGISDPPDSPGVSAGIGVALRTKLAAEWIQAGLAQDHVILPFDSSIIVPFLRLGITTLQFESLDDSFGFGMFSPYAELGTWIVLSDRPDAWFLSFAAGAEHDIRFTDQPNESYLFGVIGVGLLSDHNPPAYVDSAPDAHWSAAMPR